MNDTIQNICSFCLKTVYSNDFEVVGECIKQMLRELLISHLEISNKTLICSECATTLRDVFIFKTTFIKSEENTKLALKQEPDMKGLNVYDEQKICRFCKTMVPSECHTNLCEKEYIDMADMIQKYIPEMKCSAAEELRTCGNCLDLLQGFLNFVMNCSGMEVTIKKEVNDIDTKDNLKLNDQHSFIFKNEVDCSNIKTEKFEDDIEHMSPNEIMFKNVMREDGLELHSKNDDTENKSDQNFSERYMNTEKTELLHQCHLCPFSNYDKAKLSRHLITHATMEECAKNELTFVCDRCDFQTPLRENLSKHMEKHKLNEEKAADSCHNEFKCDKCSFVSVKRKYLRQHMFEHSEPDGPKIVECYTCGYKTKRKRALVRHIQVHAMRPYEPMPEKCHFCPYQPKTTSRLRRHLITHKTFAECAELGMTIKCDKCDFWAKHKERLYDHMKTHEPKNEKPYNQYSCDQCSYVTQTKRLLKSHLNRHLNDDSPDLALYSCDKCDFKSKWRSSRNKHMKRFHKSVEGVAEHLPNDTSDVPHK